MFKRLAKILFIIVIIASIGSCAKKTCKNVTCPVAEQCSEGYCLCLNGYEGTNCDTLSYTKYLGNYAMTSEVCSNSPTGALSNFGYYTVRVFNDPNNYDIIYLSPLFGQAEAVASIYNTPGNLGNNINVPPQVIGTVTVLQSYGNFYPATTHEKAYMVINFNYIYEGDQFACTETFSKQ